jgi:hypothetical protein
MHVAVHLKRPTREPVRAARAAQSRLLPYLVLLRAGFAVPPGVATGAVRSYRTISPLPSHTRGVRLGGLLSVALSVGSRPPGVTWRRALGARTFLCACAQRLSGRLRAGWWARDLEEASVRPKKLSRRPKEPEREGESEVSRRGREALRQAFFLAISRELCEKKLSLIVSLHPSRR